MLAFLVLEIIVSHFQCPHSMQIGYYFEKYKYMKEKPIAQGA